MTIAVDLGRKATKTNKQTSVVYFSKRDFQPLNIYVLLYGNNAFDNTLNSTLFRAVYGYIKSTKCFHNTQSYFLYLIRKFKYI